MDKKIICDMSPAESLIIKYLWNVGEGKKFGELTRYLNEEVGKSWKKQTVNTFLSRLIEKGLIVTEMTKGGKIYYAAMTEKEFETGNAQYLLDKYYNGSLQEFLTALSGGRPIEESLVKKLLAK